MKGVYKLRLAWLELIYKDALCPETQKKLRNKISFYRNKIQQDMAPD